MKNIFLFILLVACSSCSTFYYAQLNTNDPYTQKNSDGNFVTESDSLQISYAFNGENAPMKILVKNNMKRAIHINWGDSWLIFGDGNKNRVSLGKYMQEWEKISFVAPKGQKEKLLFELANLNFGKVKSKSCKSAPLVLSDNTMKNFQTTEFSEDDTPLYFRCELVLHIGSKEAMPTIYEQDFYISKLVKTTNCSPDQVAATAYEYGDYFYTAKRQSYKFLETAGGVLLITGGIVLDVMLNHSDD